MNRLLEIVLVIMYNLVLLAGASYLVIHYEVTAWIYLIALCFGASWDDSRSLLVNIAKGKSND
jgi:MFS-type transporter involved in bile tolerance (Atg22 family)